VVPEPRVFALHKLWVALQPTRDPIKRKRDLHQAEALVQLALDYFNLRFDDPAVKSLPADPTAMISGLVERIEKRRSKAHGERRALPPGFNDPDQDSDAEWNRARGIVCSAIDPIKFSRRPLRLYR
jgi:Nucleotidyltransferase